MDTVDGLIIGAGVIGLACARDLAQAGHEVLVIEKAAQVGTGASSRNSEVIHAGLYYPPGSLKAQLCVRGRELLYEYCTQRHIPHQRIGKLIVATLAEQEAELHKLHRNAMDCGVPELQTLTKTQTLTLEPALNCTAALYSPNTGIIDSHAYLLALQADAEFAGATFAFHSELVEGAAQKHGVRLRIKSHTDSRDDSIELGASFVINCAGLYGVEVARCIENESSSLTLPSAHWAKGNYFSLAARSPFSHLIYPVPEPGGLGVHLTLDLAGQARFGPDVQWLDDCSHEDYSVDISRTTAFEHAIRKYWPALPHNALLPAYAGIRSKLSGPSAPSADFQIQRDGCVIHCLGIESPGLTASLAIGEHVREIVHKLV